MNYNIISNTCCDAVHDMLKELNEDTVSIMYESLLLITDPQLHDTALEIIQTIGK